MITVVKITLGSRKLRTGSQIFQLKYRGNFSLKCDYFTTSQKINKKKQNKEKNLQTPSVVFSPYYHVFLRIFTIDSGN